MNENDFTENYEPGSAETVGAAQRARDLAGDAMSNVRSQAESAYARSEEYVRENPMPAVLGALAVGVIIGFALGHREEPTARERYVDEPLQQARDSILAALAPALKHLRHSYGDARSAARQAADSAHDFDPASYVDPVLKQARRFGERLKFW